MIRVRSDPVIRSAPCAKIVDRKAKASVRLANAFGLSLNAVPSNSEPTAPAAGLETGLFHLIAQPEASACGSGMNLDDYGIENDEPYVWDSASYNPLSNPLGQRR